MENSVQEESMRLSFHLELAFLLKLKRERMCHVRETWLQAFVEATT